LMNLDGWSLKNRENQSYAFPANFTLKAGSTARVHSKEGSNSVPRCSEWVWGNV